MLIRTDEASTPRRRCMQKQQKSGYMWFPYCGYHKGDSIPLVKCVRHVRRPYAWAEEEYHIFKWTLQRRTKKGRGKWVPFGVLEFKGDATTPPFFTPGIPETVGGPLPPSWPPRHPNTQLFQLIN